MLVGLMLCFVCLDGGASVGEEGFANEAFGSVASARGAVFASVLNELEVAAFPLFRWPAFF